MFEFCLKIVNLGQCRFRLVFRRCILYNGNSRRMIEKLGAQRLEDEGGRPAISVRPLSSVICKSNARPSVQTGGHCHFFRRISPCRQAVDKGQIAAKIPDSLAGQTVRSGIAQRRAPFRRFAPGAQNTRHHVKAADQRIVLQGAALILFGPLRRLSNSPLG